ncbi:MAG TPA: HAD family phosphatase [Bryobacteraceae bacterium]|nr:HAD family phosphatase [Bryobacteraceae bacterium]
MFDLDGVIVDSNPVHSACWREYLQAFGIQPEADFDARMYGRRNDEIVRMVFGESVPAADVTRHGADKERLYRERIGTALRNNLVAGVADFLDRHAEVPKAVATNGERANLEFILERSGFARYFAVTLNGEQVTRPKPDPEIYLRTADLLGVPPRNCVVFEDSGAGVEAARAAGTRVVGLTTTHAELPGTDLLVRDFSDPDLEQWLLTQSPE